MKRLIILVVFLTLIIAEANFHFLQALGKLKDDDKSNNQSAIKDLIVLAEKQNEPNAAYLLGYYYKTEKFQEINMNKSHNYYLKAAELGDKEAMLIVGWNFYKGIGCKGDLKKAKFWLEKLAILGDETAEEMLEYIYQ